MQTKLILAAVIAAALSACGQKETAAPEEVRPVRSTVVDPSGGSVGATYSGEILARYESRLGFQIGGRVVARLVEVGGHVKKGQVLMQLDTAQESLQVAAATADVDAAQSRVRQSRVDLQRAETLFSRNFVSQAKLDDTRLALTTAESQLKSALAQQAIRQLQRGYSSLSADRDGVVTAISAETGQVVSAGQQVITLAADGEREVQISIPESRVDELRRARTMHITVWAQPGRSYRGSLRELAPSVDSVTRTYAARISILDADAALRLGMTASVAAPDVDGGSAIRLPLTAIHNKDGRPQVWVIDPASLKVAPRRVKLGAAHNDSVLVSEGLQGGERVVTAGVHMLHAGQKVLPAARDDAAQVARR
jgi:RND family efflux transporter MFP subunit